MTLDEAIKHAEEVAEDEERRAGWFYDKEGCYKKKCIKCAEEHRQLAEWLRELKQYKEQDKPQGEWIEGNTDVYYDLPDYKCSLCGYISLENGNYCPNCGEKMGKEQE